MVKKIDLDIESIVMGTFEKEKAEILAEIDGYKQDILNADAAKVEAEADIHDALVRLQGIESVFYSLKRELSNLYDKQAKEEELRRREKNGN